MAPTDCSIDNTTSLEAIPAPQADSHQSQEAEKTVRMESQVSDARTRTCVHLLYYSPICIQGMGYQRSRVSRRGERGGG